LFDATVVCPSCAVVEIMAKSSGYIEQLLGRLRSLRESRGLSPEQIEERLILGPGWISGIESGKIVPSLGLTLAILTVLRADLTDLVGSKKVSDPVTEIERMVSADAEGDDLIIRFAYADYNASYTLHDATIGQFEEVLKRLRDALAKLIAPAEAGGEAIKTDAVASTFLTAVKLWPDANPSDLWWFLVYRAYCDPFNHPARYARMDFTQSWKRTGGGALRRCLCAIMVRFSSGMA
jgi:transcriptional regulator with XRE-family HTH domain